MISYQLTVREVVRGLMKYRRNTLGFWLRVGVGVCGLLLLVLAHLVPSLDEVTVPLVGWMLIGISTVALVGAPRALRHAISKVVRANPVFTAPKRVSLEENGLVFTSPTQKSEVTWALFKKITQDDRYFYLHSDDLGNVTLLPKSAFTEAELQNFLRFSRYVPTA